MRASEVLRVRVIASALLLGPAGIAAGQLSNASAAATGLSGAFTARATGYNAVFWNPANLAMPGNPGFSLTLLAADGGANLTPIDLQKLHDVQGTFVDSVTREGWLKQVIAHGGQSGGASGGLTELGFSLGSFAFQFNTKVATDANLSPDIVEGILFGNKGHTAAPKALQLAGSSFTGAAYSTGGLSYAIPLTSLIPLTNFALGATVKYTVGHGLIAGLDTGSVLGTDTIHVQFPGVLPDSASRKSGNIGSGIGLDLGGAWTLPGFRFGVSVQNVVNTFKWDTTKFVSRSALGVFRTDTTFTKVDKTDQPYASAPSALRAKVAKQKFKPVLAAGLSFDWIPKMTVSADVRQQMDGGIELGPKSMVSVGAEYRIIPFVPLRAGFAVMTGGTQISAGLGLHFLGFESGVAGYLRKRDGATESGGTVTLISIRP